MPGASKAIKTRIKSVSNTRKITRAMEMVAAAKMRKAVESSVAGRAYARHALGLLSGLARERALRHPLLKGKESGKELAVVIAANRGLCGGYNSNIAKAAVKYIESAGKDKVSLIIVGRKAEVVARRTGSETIASFVDFSDNLSVDDISPLSKLVIEEFASGKYSKVTLVFAEFVSGIKHEAKAVPLLPVTEENLKGIAGREEEMEGKARPSMLFEPGEERVLDLVLPRLVKAQIYQALLEAGASEHSARMITMKNASDNAENMIKDLMIYYNQARQAGITQEIAEISGGAEALTNG